MGSQFDLFLFYISPLEKSFLISKTTRVSCVFLRKNFLSPVAGSSFRWSRMGSQFDLFLFYISPLEKSFLISKINRVSCIFFARKFFIVTDGWWWWMVDGGWWMVDGGWSKKKFFNFAETWHTGSSRYINVHNFRVLVKQLSYGNEIKFQV